MVDSIYIYFMVNLRLGFYSPQILLIILIIFPFNRCHDNKYDCKNSN